MDNSEILLLKELVNDSLTKILKFVDYSDFEIQEYKDLVTEYKKESDDEKLRILRKKLNALFFEAYSECIFVCLK